MTSMIHLRVNGRSEDVPVQELGLGRYVDARDVKVAVARHLGMSPERLAPYTVETHPNGNLTVRPQAVFG